MNNALCERDNEVAAVARSGMWTDALRAHVQGCRLCSETVSLVVSLQRMSRETLAGTKVTVSHRVLWLRARFTSRHERLSRLDRLMLVAAFAAVAAVFSGLAIWKWGVIVQWVAGAFRDPGSSLPLYVLAGCAAVVWFLTEEVFLADR